jgi:transcriptional regulator with XRE-family HTH domain
MVIKLDSIGERIKNLRIKNNISQEVLAENLNISRQTISKWENDSVTPDLTSINLLCDYFKVTPNYLISGIDCENNESHNKLTLAIYIISLIIGIIVIILSIILLFQKNDTTSIESYIIIDYKAILLLIGILFVIVPITLFIIKKIKNKDVN